MRRKLLTGLLAASLLASSLTACAGKGGENAVKTENTDGFRS